MYNIANPVLLFTQTPGHTPSNSRWDETPGRSKGSETPGATPSTRMWEPTPSHTPAGAATPGRDTPGHATPGHGGGANSSVRKNRWDETPKTERGLIFCPVWGAFTNSRYLMHSDFK